MCPPAPWAPLRPALAQAGAGFFTSGGRFPIVLCALSALLRSPTGVNAEPETALGNTVSKVREFIDFWVENSVHAAEQYRTAGASQDVAELTRRLVEAANGQGISEVALQA